MFFQATGLLLASGDDGTTVLNLPAIGGETCVWRAVVDVLKEAGLLEEVHSDKR